MRGAQLTILLLGLLAGCMRGPFKGYTELDKDVYFRLNTLGDDNRRLTGTDSVLVRVRAARREEAPGSLFSTQRWYDAGDSSMGRLHDVLWRMRQGDSATVIMHGAEVPWDFLGANGLKGQDTNWVQIELSLREVMTLEDARTKATERHMLARTAADEDSLLKSFLARSTVAWQQQQGLYFHLTPIAAAAPRIRSGDLVTIAYTARFLDSSGVFDDTHRSGQPLTFRLGDPGQVIKGLEIALHLMTPRGRGQFIMPSAIAFGATGSSGNIVPPWTPVLYDVEVVSVGSDTVRVP